MRAVAACTGKMVNLLGDLKIYIQSGYQTIPRYFMELPSYLLTQYHIMCHSRKLFLDSKFLGI